MACSSRRPSAERDGAGARPHKWSKNTARAGIAVVELAATLPLIVFVVLGAIQAAHMIQLKHSCHFIVDDVLRLAVQTDANNGELKRQGSQFCRDVEINGAQFKIRRRPASSVILVTMSVPFAENFVGATVFPTRPITVSRTAYLEQ